MPQSMVARVESGQTNPGWDTLIAMLSAAGFELRAHLETAPATGSHMLGDVGRILRLTPEQRLLELRNASRFFSGAVRA